MACKLIRYTTFRDLGIVRLYRESSLGHVQFADMTLDRPEPMPPGFWAKKEADLKNWQSSPECACGDCQLYRDLGLE